MLKGKHCNYGIRGVKYVYETIQRAKIEAFEDWLSRKISLLTIVSRSPKSLMKCALIVTLKVSKQPWKMFQVLSFLFEEFQSILQDEEKNSMRAYWMAFLDMTQVLLDYAKFICIGNWELHVAAFERMLS